MKRCEKFNILFMISPDREIYRDGEPCDGFFEAPEKGNSGILALCIGKDLSQVLHTLAHEFSHVMQWYEDDPIYEDPGEEIERREYIQTRSRHRTSSLRNVERVESV